MKRFAMILFFALLVINGSEVVAAKARYLTGDGNTAYHSRHLSMHIGDETCRASGNYLKVRRTAGGSAVVGHVEQADLLELLDVQNGWGYVRVLYSAETSPDSWPGLTGWVDGAYLECGCSERAYYGGYTDGIEGGEILSGGVNLRELPSTGSRSLATCRRGEQVRVLGRYTGGGDTFYRVVRSSGQNGFVKGSYLEVGGSAPRFSYSGGKGSSSGSRYTEDTSASSSSGDSVRATVSNLRVRQTPGGTVIGHISSLDTLALLERSYDWARIRVTAARSGYEDNYNGLTGWVSTEYLRFGSAHESGSAPARDSFAGSYTDAYGENSLRIARSGGQYSCQLGIYRLTTIDAYGQDRGGWLDMQGTDAAGNPIRFAVTKQANGDLMVSITQTTWAYLSNGDTFLFE